MNALEAAQAIRRLVIDYTGVSARRVWISGERENIPKDQGLFITLTPGSPEIMAQTSRFRASDSSEVLMTHLSLSIALDVCSRGPDAISRYHEVVAALATDAAKRDMEEKQYSVMRARQITDLSAVAGTGVLRRYRIQAIVQYMDTAMVAAESYDKFRAVETLEEA